MSLGPVMLDLESTRITEEEKELLLHPLVGGVILFTRNYESVEQITQLVKQVHSLRQPGLLIAVDHEGGRVQRFRDGFTALPAVAHFGEIYRHNRNRARQMARSAAWLMASELRAVGVDFSFAPVLDIDYGNSSVIGDRAFHQQADIVAELAHVYIEGMDEAGMASTGKHFPGHGYVAADSHTDIPVDHREYNDIYAHDIVPFRKLIKYGMAAVMPAHVIYDRVDSLPAGFSPFWLKDVLRKKLGFQGVIFSDDLDMAGAGATGQNYAERADAALSAGCDMVLVCNNRPAAIEVIDGMSRNIDAVSQLRLARMHGRHPLSMNELHRMQRWKTVTENMKRYQEDPSLEFDFEN